MSTRVKKASSIDVIYAALPAAQEAVRSEIAKRTAAGEAIGRVEADTIITESAPRRSLRARREELLKCHAVERESRERMDHKSVA